LVVFFEGLHYGMLQARVIRKAQVIVRIQLNTGRNSQFAELIGLAKRSQIRFQSIKHASPA
jgi:hypothetical protein